MHCKPRADLFGRASPLCTAVSIPLRQQQPAEAATHLPLCIYLPFRRRHIATIRNTKWVGWPGIGSGKETSAPSLETAALGQNAPLCLAGPGLPWDYAAAIQFTLQSLSEEASLHRWPLDMAHPLPRGCSPPPVPLLPLQLSRHFLPPLIKLTYLTQAFFFP